MCQEIGSLPVGPSEEGSWWWAQARLAYSSLGIHVWSKHFDKWFGYVSRITDKSAWYPISILEDMLTKRLDLTGIDTITVWSDAGTHFRCRHLLWYVGIRLLEKFPALKLTTCEFGCECHFKEACDCLSCRLYTLSAYSRGDVF